MNDDAEYHAHIECSKQLSARSLYFALNDLLLKVNPQADVIVEKLLRTLDELKVISRNSEGMVNVLEKIDIWIEMLQCDHYYFTDKRCDDELKNFTWPPSAIQISIWALQLYSSDEPKMKHSTGLPNDFEDINIFYLFGAIWIWNNLGLITSISSSSIRCASSLLTSHPELLENLPVQFDVTEKAEAVTFDGLILLKAIMAQNAIYISKSLPMIIRFTTSSQVDTPIAIGEKISRINANDNKIALRNEATCLIDEQNDIETSDLWNVDKDITLLETNIDDRTPEHLAYITEILINHSGVLDCWIAPIIMKKGRGAHLLSCLCRNEDRIDVLQLMFRHCTIGIRVFDHLHGLRRVALRRRIIKINIIEDAEIYDESNEDHISCKIAYLGQDIVSIKPEFEDCKRLALRHGNKLSLQRIHEIAIQNARSQCL